MRETNWHQRIAVRLFRLWAIARENGEPTLVRMYDAATEFRLPDRTTPSCASLFALTEGALSRNLVRGAACAPNFTADECALLGVIEAAPSLGAMRGSTVIPHGLPGAIRWAAMCVRDALEWPDAEPMTLSMSSSRRKCPFAGGAETRLAS